VTAAPALSSIPGANTGLFAAVGGSADAVGTQTSTLGVAETFAGGGMAVGLAAFIAYAQNTDSNANPHTAATTFGGTGGGDIATSASDTISIDFPYGPTPVSLTASLTFVGAYGPDPVSAHLIPHDAFSSVSLPASHHIA
jgi:hypothetical protein